MSAGVRFLRGQSQGMGLLIVAALLLPEPSRSACSCQALAEETRPRGVLAVVNGEAITADRVEKEIAPHLAQLEQQAQRLRQTVLLRLIHNLLLEQAARKEGLSVEEYLQRELGSPAVSGEEVEQAFMKHRERFPGLLEAEAKHRIRRDMEESRRAEGLRRLLERLQREAVIVNYSLDAVAAELEKPPVAWRGAAAARVTVVEFCDLQCAYCRKAQSLIRELLVRWPSEVRLLYRHFPLPSHPEAYFAAIAAVCAERQGLFWEFLDAMHARGPNLSPSVVKDVARTVGLEERDFEECLKDPASASRVRADVELGTKVGVDATPAFFVNGRRVLDVSRLEEAILGALSQPKPEIGRTSP